MYQPAKVAIVGATKPAYELYCPHWSGLLYGFAQNGIDAVLINSRENEFWYKEVVTAKPDVVIFGLLSAVTNTEARTYIRQKLPNAILVFWYGDARTDATDQVSCDISKEIDVFVQSNDGLKLFSQEKFGIIPSFLPLACNVKDKPLIKDKYKFPLLFIGSKVYSKGFEERAHIIDFLEKYHALKVINAAQDPLRSTIYKEMYPLYASAVTTLDISHFWDIPKYTSNRYWVIPAYWGLALTRRFPGHEELYPEDTRVYWSTTDELIDKMKFYLQHADERAKMITKCWEHTRDNHTYAHRVKRLFEIIDGGTRVSRKSQRTK